MDFIAYIFPILRIVVGAIFLFAIIKNNNVVFGKYKIIVYVIGGLLILSGVYRLIVPATYENDSISRDAVWNEENRKRATDYCIKKSKDTSVLAERYCECCTEEISATISRPTYVQEFKLSREAHAKRYGPIYEKCSLKVFKDEKW